MSYNNALAARHDAVVARRVLEHALAAMLAAEDELGRLDAAAGDGDHGAGMVRGFRAAAQSVVDSDASAGAVLTRAGAAFSDAAGGASGALYGMLLTTIGESIRRETDVNASAITRGLQEGLATLQYLGKAKPGDKTMIDTLHPFVQALAASTSEGRGLAAAWNAALPAAETGAAATADMICTRGRAARLGERSRGHRDAGAVSMLYVLRAVGEALAADNR